MHPDELKMTIETLVDLDEPEAILPALKSVAVKKGGKRWRDLAQAIAEVEDRIAKAGEPQAKPAEEGDATAETD